MDNFVVFILTHGRADNVITFATLKREGYTGKVVLVVDNEDETVDEYKKRYGDENVYVFDKKAVSLTFDTMDLSEDRRTIVYARNACFDIAKELGFRYFLELDDDYQSFEHRYPSEDGKKLMVDEVKDLDAVFSYMVKFLQTSGADTVAFAQGGDFIGGISGANYKKKVLRKVMNTFFCDTEKPFKFIGRINEDVNTYTARGSVGWLGLTITDISIRQKQTQSNKGGMSDVYIDSGTYLKSFYSVMAMPSAVKIGAMGDSHIRFHHKVEWDLCVPKILNERMRKKRFNDTKDTI